MGQEALGALFLMAGIVTIVYIIARYSYLTKRAMIERGLVNPEAPKTRYFLDISCIIFSLGLGLIISTLYTSMEISEDTTDLLIWGTILIFGAIGLFLADRLRKRSE